MHMDRQTQIGRKFRELREAAKLSQPDLAARADTPVQNISRLERGERKMSLKWAELFAPLLGVTPESLLTGIGDGPTPAPQSQTVSIPDLAIHAGMGNGGLLDISVDEHGRPTDPDQVRGWWSFPDYVVAGIHNLKRCYAFAVTGDSMSPTLEGGSVVFVDTSQNRIPPEDVYAIDYGDGLMVKRLSLVPRSEYIKIISDNDRYDNYQLNRDDVQIYGRIIGYFQWRG